MGRAACECLYIVGNSTRVEGMIHWCVGFFDTPLKQGVSINEWIHSAGGWVSLHFAGETIGKYVKNNTVMIL